LHAKPLSLNNLDNDLDNNLDNNSNDNSDDDLYDNLSRLLSPVSLEPKYFSNEELSA